MTKTFKSVLSRSFATVECDPITGAKKETIIDGHSIVTGNHYLAPFEIELLVKELREIVAGKHN